MKRVSMGIMLACACASASWAEMTVMSLQERVWSADVILVCTVKSSDNTGVIKEVGTELWLANCESKRELKGKVKDATVHVGFIQVPMQKPQPQALRAGVTYLLFLKEPSVQGPPYELIDPYHGALEYEQSHQIYDEAATIPVPAPMTGEAIAERVAAIVSDPTRAPHQVQLERAQQVADRIIPGMKRSQVEAWFKQRDGGLQGPSVTRYYEHPGVMIEVPFDRTGGDWSQENHVNGPVKVYQSLPHGD